MQQLVDKIIAVNDEMGRVNVFTMAASLAFSSLLSLLPIIAIALAFIPKIESHLGDISVFLSNYIMPAKIALETSILSEISENAALISIPNLALSIGSGLFLVKEVEDSLSITWKTVDCRESKLQKLYRRWSFLTFIPLTFGTVAWTIWQWCPSYLISPLGIILLIGFIYILNRSVTNGEIPNTPLLIASTMSGFGIYLMKLFLDKYLEISFTYGILLGSASAVLGLLLWIWLLWSSLLLPPIITRAIYKEI